MARDELQLTLGKALDADGKLAGALRQLLAERLARATVRAAEEQLGEREAGHAAGRIAEIASLQAELAHCLRAAAEAVGSRRRPTAV